MLDPLQVISEHELPIVPLPDTAGPAACLLELAFSLSRLFGEPPAVLRPPGSGTLTLLYRNAAYLLQDVVDDSARRAAALSRACPAEFYGVTEGRETAEWTVTPLDPEAVLVRLRSASGRPFDHLEGLGVRVELPDGETAGVLAELCAASPFLEACAVLSPRAAALLWGSPLVAPVQGSRFSYLAWEPLPNPQLLSALAAGHKVTLWREFLAQGLQPPEFHWLWTAYYTQEPLFLLEWELALRTALEELGFQVERTQRSFRVLDWSGRERRFDFARGGPAEKVFLKLLFPLDTK